MATKIYLCLNKNDIVTGIMITDYSMIHPERYEWTIADYTLIGKQFDKVNETFSDPAPKIQTEFTRLEFRHKFTLAEMSDIYAAEDLDPVIKIILDDLSVAELINTADPATQNGIGYLYNSGYLTYERMQEILG